ncbi:TPA: hypothetical protein ACX6QA_003377 [Photobacterium damselae]
MNKISLAVDAIPNKLIPDFLKRAKEINEFWFDMFLLCVTFGLRNIECRELKISQINLKEKKIILSNTKSDKALLTRTVNQHIDKKWNVKGREWLRNHMIDPNASLIVRLASSLAELSLIAEEYQLSSKYEKAKRTFYDKERKLVYHHVKKTLPLHSRVIDFSSFNNIENMLSRRLKKYEGRTYLFPRDELIRKNSTLEKDAPLSRQSVYNVIKKIHHSFGNKLKGIRLGLHSCRKSAVQKVATLMKDTFAASVWIGHGYGKGNLSMTERYLDRSKHRFQEINQKLSKELAFMVIT